VIFRPIDSICNLPVDNVTIIFYFESGSTSCRSVAPAKKVSKGTRMQKTFKIFFLMTLIASSPLISSLFPKTPKDNNHRVPKCLAGAGVCVASLVSWKYFSNDAAKAKLLLNNLEQKSFGSDGADAIVREAVEKRFSRDLWAKNLSLLAAGASVAYAIYQGAMGIKEKAEKKKKKDNKKSNAPGEQGADGRGESGVDRSLVVREPVVIVGDRPSVLTLGAGATDGGGGSVKEKIARNFDGQHNAVTLTKHGDYEIELDVTRVRPIVGDQSDRRDFEMRIKKPAEGRTCFFWRLTAATYGQDEFKRNLHTALSRCHLYLQTFLNDGRTNFDDENAWQSVARGWRINADGDVVKPLLCGGHQRYTYRNADDHMEDLDAREDEYRDTKPSWTDEECRDFMENVMSGDCDDE